MSEVEQSSNVDRPAIDMSGEAVMQRLLMVGELNELCWFLGESDLAKKAAAQAGVAWKSPRLLVSDLTDPVSLAAIRQHEREANQ